MDLSSLPYFLIFFFKAGHHLIGAFTCISEGARTGGKRDMVILVCHAHLVACFETEVFFDLICTRLEE